MSHSFHTTDRATYRKIVVVAVAAIVAMTFIASYGRGESKVDTSNRKVAIYRPSAPSASQALALAELK
ncbi:hypothetical protein [Bradyrhizobium sp. C9]|uniref:hypothetical protein n=1 Tax=Bradyrhizobium sp. C9 TaxID=142585 RepID=UPI001177B669|nr:hypothetical protein [Bradyrhizobium sp. C9]